MENIICKCNCHNRPKDHKGIRCCDRINEPRNPKNWQIIQALIHKKLEVYLEDRQVKTIINIVKSFSKEDIDKG